MQFAYGCDGCNTTINSGVPNSVIDDFNGNNASCPTWLISKPIESGQLGRLIQKQRFWLAQINIVARQRRRSDQGTGEGLKAGALSAPLQVEAESSAFE